MRIAKLVTGIISIVLFVLVTFQSCAAGVGNALLSTGEVSGSAGFVVAIALLAGGIVSICSRNGGRAGALACTIIYSIGAIFGFMLAGTIYKDLNIWSGICLILAIMHLISRFAQD